MIYRIYIGCIVLLWAFLGLLHYLDSVGDLVLAVSFFASVPAILAAFSAMFVFHWGYSCLGARVRRDMPDAEPLAEAGVLGQVHPFSVVQTPLAVAVFEQGVGITILWIWRVFLPWEEICRIEANRSTLGMKVKVVHKSPELRHSVVWWMDSRNANSSGLLDAVERTSPAGVYACRDSEK